MFWRIIFNNLMKELQVTQRRREVLEKMKAEGKVTPESYDYLKGEIEAALNIVDIRKGDLQKKLTKRKGEVTEQLQLFQRFSSSIEIWHATEEMDDENFKMQNSAIEVGLKATQDELTEIDQCLPAVAPKEPETSPEAVKTAEAVIAEAGGEERSPEGSLA